MTWFYMGKPYTQTPEEYQGFVYEITNTTNGMKYIGKKNFWRTIKRKPLKGKSNRRHSRVESDWQGYYGSNKTLQHNVETLGPDHFERKILVLCANKNQMSYFEMRFQMDFEVLFRDDYYNEYIGGRITPRGLKSN